MNVAKLIEKLKEFDPDLPVYSGFGEHNDREEIGWVGLDEEIDWSANQPLGQPRRRIPVVRIEDQEPYRSKVSDTPSV